MIFSLAIIFCLLSMPPEQPDIAGQKTARSGPALLLDYKSAAEQKNPIEKFMYFVPLVSPTTVAVSTGPDTTLNAAVTTHKILRECGNFTALCEFEIKGSGTYSAVFDPNQMMAFNSRFVDNQKPLRYMLHSIRIAEPCRGLIKVSGSIEQSTKTIDKILVSFNREDSESPVSVRLYDVPCTNGDYNYQNRYNEQIARINSLEFTKTENNTARMGVCVCSVRPINSSENLLARIRATLANWLLPPMPITVKGNDTMLEFAKALTEKQPIFVFPYADNLRR